MSKMKLNVDLGIREYEIGGGVLRMNPSDPNLYDRFVQAGETIRQLEKALVEKAKALSKEEGQENGVAVVRLMSESDREVKDTLNQVFGLGNDFNVILKGVNLMAVGDNGERIITNLMNALIPLVKEGAKQLYTDKADAAVALATANRAQRRAAAKAGKE